MPIYTSRRVSSIRNLDLGDVSDSEKDLKHGRSFGSQASIPGSATVDSTEVDDSSSDSSISVNDDGFADDDSWYHGELGSYYSTEFRRSALIRSTFNTTATARTSTTSAETNVTIGTFNAMLFEESLTCTHEDTIMIKRDSFCGPLISEEEQEELEKASSTFSRNMGFLGGLIKEAASNMRRTAAVLREEPKPRILKAVVQAKVENLGNNVGTLTSRICTNTSTICSDTVLGITQHGQNKWLGASQHGFKNRNEEQGGGANWLGCSQHGYSIHQSRERRESNCLGLSVHGYGKNHLKEKGAMKCLGRSVHGVQHQIKDWEQRSNSSFQY